MKEHQTEQKAKAYDEAIKRAKGVIEQNPLMEYLKKGIEYIFPELKENEDEMIRKAISYVLNNADYSLIDNTDFTASEMEAWLEKLGGKKSKTPNENIIDCIGMCLTDADEQRFKDYNTNLKECLSWLEKQGEQVSAIRWYDASFIPQEYKELLVEWNSSDATWHDVAFYHADTKTFLNYERELKNVTRWCYVDDLFGEQSNVKETGISQHDKPQGKSALEAINEEKVDTTNKVEPKSEFKVGDCNGTVVSPCIPPCENNFHLWTLSDVKNGDILYSPSLHLIWIYKDNKEVHAGINMNYASSLSIGTSLVIPNDAYLATKLQRDVLFEKMHEAGYGWDAEKKKLKKIEQKSVWSEDDEKKRNLLIDILNVNHPNGRFKVNPINTSNMEAMSTKELVSWLKSLRPQSTWKPSDEQLEAFENFVRGIWESCYDSPYENNAKLLYSLLEQLKKLK